MKRELRAIMSENLVCDIFVKVKFAKRRLQIIKDQVTVKVLEGMINANHALPLLLQGQVLTVKRVLKIAHI
jgi:hypothetical protein